DLILADEPTGALDSKTTDEIMALFQTLHEEYNITIIIITHNPDIAGQCKRIKRMHEGTLIDN
ncbi:MAG: macrolide ABC transporter ATP-binding protein, partial [Chlamydiota bacterium]|nr:macrolide ABC transporter ATP-binding protein [Chlamydiota bacterium]